MSDWINLARPLAVGDSKTLKFDGYYIEGSARANNATVSSAVVHGYDIRERLIEGTVDGGGTTTLGDADVLNGYTSDSLIGLPMSIYDTGGRRYQTEITDSDATAATVTFYTCGVTPAAGDLYSIDGHPLLAQTSATVASNRVSYQVSAADMTAYPGRRALVFKVTLQDGDVEDVVIGFEVKASKPD